MKPVLVMIPLWPAGLSAHKEQDRVAEADSAIAGNGAGGAPCQLSPSGSRHAISSLVGEMPGRAEGGEFLVRKEAGMRC